MQLPRGVQVEADARLRAAFDHASTGMTVVDDSGLYVEVNRAFADLLGYRVDELLGRHFSEVTLAGEHDSDVAMMGDLISGARRSVVREKQYRHRDGTLLVALVSSYLVRPGTGPSWQLLSTIESLTEERAAQQRLFETRTAGDGIVTVDDAGIVVAWNTGAERVFGHPAADRLGKPLDELVPLRLRENFAAHLRDLLAGSGSLLGRTVEVPARHADGRELLTELSLSTWQHDGHARFTAITRDVTVKRRAEQAAALIRHAALTANCANSFVEAAAEVVRQVCTRLGWRAGQAWTASGGPVAWHVEEHHHASPASGCALRRLAEQGSAPTPQQLSLDAVARVVSDPAGLGPMGPAVCECGIGSAVAVPVLAGGEVTGMLGFYLPTDCPAPDHDLVQALEQVGLALGRVVERQRTSEALAWQATHDPVTDLANRRLLLEHIRRTRQQSATLLLINLDRFRLVNDALGYAIGDQVLRLAGNRLRAAVGAEDLVARLSADEFVVVATTPGATELAERLLHDLREPLTIGGHELVLRASVGIRAVTGDDPEHFPAAVLRDADAALRQAKSRGKDQIVVFDEAMAGSAEQRMDDEIALARAITEEQLTLHYQPIIGLDTGRPVSAEALVRWHRPGHGMQAPDRFIPMAEDSGLIIDLGRWVLHQACRDAAAWPDRAPAMADATVSVNVSARQLTHPRFLADLQSALAESGLPPERLILEITETALISAPEAAMETLHAVRACGVQLALDDFGTGYSSLSYVQKLPASILKIDKSFVDPISGPGAGTALSEVVIKLAEAIGMRTVAEGVESPEQATALRLLGCHRGQGYTWSRPVPNAELQDAAMRLAGAADVPQPAS
ncbi:GGDEF domain-containing protein [Actinoplanes ianthinogenes]|uniref:GGDEF domain-containing protein n=1 Tax=Actinoplanes ianthinogenes TaxID=122358 RepID=A0ABN6CLZ1_9ACTN|nr:GGDEF domain-containing phosphodiesterase [Actinoplanes ianthinogenes]BCJ46031.1 GGDEF domain-containing protein [Actinoplanes ianthinogenes]GGR25784.1 GGDEF domain-containing protein [Actinoplanes ianthinogenes]